MDAKGLTPLLNVEDTGRSLDFYCDHLGFEVKAQHPPEGSPAWARIARGGMQLMINCPQNADSSDRRGHQSYGDVVFAFDVPDAPAAQAELAGAGLDVSEVKQEMYGCEFLLQDPDGYQLSISDTVGSTS